mmetsp:Transcript_15679/g.37391  ORF Transcript_15679/g.37391 Transcript_15679/m.37391 type:complete len:207 (-) Transcript_15679:39-659(-)
MNSGNTTLDEHLRELHDGGETTVAGVSVSDDGSEKVDTLVLRRSTLLLAHHHALFPLLSVVEGLGHEELVNFVRHRVHGIVSEIGARLVARGSGGRRLPSRNIDHLQVLSHLNNLNRVQRAESGGERLVLGTVLQNVPQLLRRLFPGEILCRCATKPHELLSFVEAADVLKARLGPPFLHLLDLLFDVRFLISRQIEIARNDRSGA